MNVWETTLRQTRQPLVDFEAYLTEHHMEDSYDSRNTIKAAVAEYTVMASA